MADRLMSDRLAVIVPTRGRPDNIRKVISAWDFTNAWDVADLVLAVDADDPEIQGYRDVVAETDNPDTGEPLIRMVTFPGWQPMVTKLNATAVMLADEAEYLALGFAGDDHLPQTINWAKTYLSELRALGTGMVYGDDGYQGRKLSTEWAITADAVRALGKMVPAPVDHMYCDNAIMDLFEGAGALKHLPAIRIEHMHPIAGKADNDEQYRRVNSSGQFKKDRAAYESWKNGQRLADVATIKSLRPGRPATPTRQRSKPSMNRFPFPASFKQVKAVTPNEIALTLADLAMGVPADQEIVELGVYHGRTTLIMAWGAQQGNGAHVTGIDPWELDGNVYGDEMGDLAGARAWARYWVRGLGYSNKIRLVQAFSHDAAAEWETAPQDLNLRGRIGLLFIDGDHTFEGATRDVRAWAPHLAPGATIAVDDYVNPGYPGVAQAIDALVADGTLEPVTVFHDRLGVTRLKQHHLAAGERSQDGQAAPEDHVVAVTAHLGLRSITGEGVSPSPYPAAPGQVVDQPSYQATESSVLQPNRAPLLTLEEEWRRADPEGMAALEASAAKLDDEVSKRGYVQPDELIEIEAGTPIDDLNLVNLKALAKARGIVLGIRKDKRDAILQALRDGR